jgi:hypothetical protein
MARGRFSFPAMTMNTPSPKKRGRPTKYTPELAERICALIEAGKSEAQICAMPDMPVEMTLRNWKDANPEFLALSARARALAADRFNTLREQKAERLVELAEDAVSSGDPIPRGVVEAYKAVMQEYARSAAIRDDSRYGDRKHVNVAGATDGEPIKLEHELPELSAEQMLEIARMHQAKT